MLSAAARVGFVIVVGNADAGLQKSAARDKPRPATLRHRFLLGTGIIAESIVVLVVDDLVVLLDLIVTFAKLLYKAENHS